MNYLYNILRADIEDTEEGTSKLSWVQWEIKGFDDEGNYIGRYTNLIDFFSYPNTPNVETLTTEEVIELVKYWQNKNNMDRTIKAHIMSGV